MDLLDKGKISGFQFFTLLVAVRLAPVTLICPTVSLVARPATAWINDVVGGLLAIPLTWLIVSLSLKYPDKTIIGYVVDLLGSVAGKAIGLLIVLFYFMVAAVVIRTLGESLLTSVMQATPLVVIIASAVFLAANSARNGMEINSRVASVLTPMVVFLLIIIAALDYNYMDFQYLRPIFFPSGLTELVWPSASVLSFYTEFLIIGMLVPYLNCPRQALPLSLGALLFSLIIMLIQCIAMAAIFGPLLNSMTLPSLMLARIVSLGPFWERMESLIIGVWLFSAGVKVSLFIWATAVGLSQLLGSKDYRPMVYPVSGLMIPISILSYQSLIELLNVLTGSMTVCAISFLLLLLLVLYISRGISSRRAVEEVKND